MDDTIIVKVLAGEASDTEIQALNTWKGLNEENQKLYEHTKSIWDQSTVPIAHAYDIDTAWYKVKDQSFQTVKVIPIWQRPIFKAAAIVVMCLAIYWVVKVGSNELENGGLQEIAALSPMNHTLPDGSIIDLEKGSVLRYELPFGGQEVREIEVTGNAYVHITKQEKTLFRVKTSLAKIESQSSSFELINTDDQYDVIVRKGTLKVSPIYTGEQSRGFNNTLKSMVGEIGEKLSLKAFNGEIQLTKNPVDWYNDVENQMFVFNTLPLKDCIDILIKHFKKQIVIEERFNHCQISFSIMYNDLNTGLKNLSDKLDANLRDDNGFEIISFPDTKAVCE